MARRDPVRRRDRPAVRAEREAPLEPHRRPAEDLFTRFVSSPAGLAEAEAQERLRHDGPNALTEAPRPSLVLRIGRHLGHRFALMLWAGAVLAFIGEQFSPGQGMGLIAVALVAVVFINGVFSFWQETRAERAMAAFRRMLSPQARVLRDGSELEIDAGQVVAPATSSSCAKEIESPPMRASSRRTHSRSTAPRSPANANRSSGPWSSRAARVSTVAISCSPARW